MKVLENRLRNEKLGRKSWKILFVLEHDLNPQNDTVQFSICSLWCHSVFVQEHSEQFVYIFLMQLIFICYIITVDGGRSSSSSWSRVSRQLWMMMKMKMNCSSSD